MEDRKLDLMERNEGTREKFRTEVKRFELDQIMQHYRDNAGYKVPVFRGR